MPKCKKCGSDTGIAEIDLFTGICPKCRDQEKSEIRQQRGRYAEHLRSHPLKDHGHLAIPLTTTQSYPGYTIESVHGLVCGEAVMGANFLKDLTADFVDVFGGRSRAYEDELRDGRAIALSGLQYEAYKLGANCVIGCYLDYETVGEKMFMIVATGTAVTVVEPSGLS